MDDFGIPPLIIVRTPKFHKSSDLTLLGLVRGPLLSCARDLYMGHDMSEQNIPKSGYVLVWDFSITQYFDAFGPHSLLTPNKWVL